MIDSHVHLDLKRYKNVKKASTELLKEMNKADVEKAIIFADGLLSKNEHIDKACSLYPDKFYGFGMVNPKAGKRKIINDLKRLASKKWCKGIKLHPRTQDFTLRHPGVRLIAEKAASFDLPIAIDCFPVFKLNDLDEGAFPNAFDRLAKKSPGTKIIMAHMGGHRLLDAFCVAKSNPNIFLEVSYTFYFYKGSSVENDMAFAIKKLQEGRTIYGSDYPSIGIKDGLKTFKKLCDKHRVGTSLRRYLFGRTIQSVIHV